jgi:NAD(P)-dependent dehydrogenase (short-subunit alcohol dehydrogenase family)
MKRKVRMAVYLEDLFSLKGKVALVTGAGRGIGQVVALGLAKAGATIAIFSRTGAADTVEMIRALGGTAYDLKVDVTREDQVDAGVAEVLRLTGSVDILFNNAGVCLHKDTLEATIDEWREVIDINLTGEYIMARAVARAMVERGVKGCIINMASMSGSVANIPQWQASYNASKAGVIHLTRSLALEWAPYGIRVNSLSPGYINTPMSVDTPQELKDAWLPLIPQHRFGEPEELMPAILYLTSPMAGYTTGTDLIVDGGYTAF